MQLTFHAHQTLVQRFGQAQSIVRDCFVFRDKSAPLPAKSCASCIKMSPSVSSRSLSFVVLSERGFFCAGYLDPRLIWRRLGIVVVVPVPPLVRLGLWITLGRVLPRLLTAKRRDIEIAPDGSHSLVAPLVDEIRAEHLVAVAKEHVMAVPLIDAEVHVEAVGDRVPRNLLPPHPRFQECDVRLCGA